MNVLLAPDKFKGSLSARALCAALTRGLSRRYPGATIRSCPLADGGDGTLAVLADHLDLREVSLAVTDPLGRPLAAAYLAGEDTAFIEVAAASGLVLLTETERDPLATSTRGTGLLLRDALARGKRDIYLLLGGSATNDLGLGIAHALGVRFRDAAGKDLPSVGGSLHRLAAVEFPDARPWEQATTTLLCDVDNPLYGPRGAAHVYAAQKGADPATIDRLDAGLRHAAGVLRVATGRDVSRLAGGGAAGGIGAGLVALLGARLRSGFAAIADLVALEAQVQWADVVISGEGQVDGQSLQGKVVGGVLDLCERHAKPCHLVVGNNDLPPGTTPPAALRSVAAVLQLTDDVGTAMRDAERLVEELAAGHLELSGGT